MRWTTGTKHENGPSVNDTRHTAQANGGTTGLTKWARRSVGERWPADDVTRVVAGGTRELGRMKFEPREEADDEQDHRTRP
jgi:hypothetical protein